MPCSRLFFSFSLERLALAFFASRVSTCKVWTWYSFSPYVSWPYSGKQKCWPAVSLRCQEIYERAGDANDGLACSLVSHACFLRSLALTHLSFFLLSISSPTSMFVRARFPLVFFPLSLPQLYCAHAALPLSCVSSDRVYQGVYSFVTTSPLNRALSFALLHLA